MASRRDEALHKEGGGKPATRNLVVDVPLRLVNPYRLGPLGSNERPVVVRRGCC